jgi:hypothetical protein
MKQRKDKRPTIKQIEDITDDDEYPSIEMWTDGSIGPVKKRRGRPRKIKPLTLQENLG